MITELKINTDLYSEIVDPIMTFAEIVALLMSFTDEELETLDEQQFANSLLNSYA